MKHLSSGPQTSLLNKNANYFSYFGADELMQKIRAYWAKRGLFPDVWKEVMPVTVTGEEMYQVRSNMVGGRPL